MTEARSSRSRAKRVVVLALMVLTAVLPLEASAGELGGGGGGGTGPAVPPPAAPLQPREAAKSASEAVDQHCADVAGAGATRSAGAIAEVGPVLAEVSRSYDLSGEPFLLYWRARLAGCLSLEERSSADFSAFLAAVGEGASYAEQVKDARQRLGKLQQPTRRPRPLAAPALLGAGAGTLSAGILTSAISLERGRELLPQLETGPGWDDQIGVYRGAYDAERVGAAIAGTGTALLLSGLVAIAIDAARTGRRSRR